MRTRCILASTRRTPGPSARRRGGVAAVEFALLLPFVVFLLVVAIDFARIFYFSLTVTNCARNGAIYACDPTAAQTSPYTSVTEAALADASNIVPTPTVDHKIVDNTYGADQVEVTVSYTFSTITKYPFIPSTFNVSRTVKMRMTRATPYF